MTMFYNVEVTTTNKEVVELLTDCGYEEYEPNVYVKPEYEYNNYSDMITDVTDLLRCNYDNTNVIIV